MENRQMPGLYGTLGLSCQDADMLIQLIRAGMTGLRINLSHGTLSGCAAWLEQVRAAERSTGQQLDLLIDLQGPEIRLGDFAAFDVEPGQLISLGDGGIPAPRSGGCRLAAWRPYFRRRRCPTMEGAGSRGCVGACPGNPWRYAAASQKLSPAREPAGRYACLKRSRL